MMMMKKKITTEKKRGIGITLPRPTARQNVRNVYFCRKRSITFEWRSNFTRHKYLKRDNSLEIGRFQASTTRCWQFFIFVSFIFSGTIPIHWNAHATKNSGFFIEFWCQFLITNEIWVANVPFCCEICCARSRYCDINCFVIVFFVFCFTVCTVVSLLKFMGKWFCHKHALAIKYIYFFMVDYLGHGPMNVMCI